MPMIASLRFSPAEIKRYAATYPVADDLVVEDSVAPAVKERGWLNKSDLVTICNWKSPRSRRSVANNADDFVRAVTGTALSHPDERLRIEVLTLLDGVSWPSASVILHLCHRDSYPILDFRALWSLSLAVPSRYDFGLWSAYVAEARCLAGAAGVSMRTLDRALWAYSKAHQRPAVTR